VRRLFVVIAQLQSLTSPEADETEQNNGEHNGHSGSVDQGNTGVHEKLSQLSVHLVSGSRVQSNVVFQRSLLSLVLI
jgi:hypothetical protein